MSLFFLNAHITNPILLRNSNYYIVITMEGHVYLTWDLFFVCFKSSARFFLLLVFSVLGARVLEK
jgi:hypothetical protein